jgi:uncharacterized C2H2 Zn-finger protein
VDDFASGVLIGLTPPETPAGKMERAGWPLEGTMTADQERRPTCGATFESRQDLDEHRLQADHPALPAEDKFECERCGFVMESSDQLQRHVEQAHGARD